MSDQMIRFKSAREFGRSLGLTDIEMELAKQKSKLIQQLKQMRIKKGISQAALAKTLGSKQPAIARMEAGQVSDVSMDFLIRAALALKVTVKIGAMKNAA